MAGVTTDSQFRAGSSWLPHVGTYRRELPVSLERLYENALDWEHLPWLHRSSFRSIECLAAGPSWWRARIGLESDGREAGEVVQELALDRDCRRWISRTLDGDTAGTEIWTHAFPMGDRRTDVVVDFFVPGASAQERGAYLAAYTDLYERLYDEDVWMMTVRQTHLDVRRSTSRAGEDLIDLGPLEVVCAQLPLRIESRGREYRVVEVSGELIAHAVVCPHLLGPLGDADVLDGVVQCPWHGYRFDVRSGANCSGQRCRLPAAPKLHVDTASQHVFAAWG